MSSAPGLLLVLAAISVAAAVANTYFWSYWTIAYLQLEDGAPAAAA